MNWNPKEKLLYTITKYECSSLDQWIRYIHEVMFITTSEFTQNSMKSLDVHVYTFLFCCSVITYHPCSMVCWWGVSSHCCLLLWLGCHQSITSVNSQEIQSIGICLFTCHHLFITSADCHSWLLIAPICLVRGGAWRLHKLWSQMWEQEVTHHNRMCFFLPVPGRLWLMTHVWDQLLFSTQVKLTSNYNISVFWTTINIA